MVVAAFIVFFGILMTCLECNVGNSECGCVGVVLVACEKSCVCVLILQVDGHFSSLAAHSHLSYSLLHDSGAKVEAQLRLHIQLLRAGNVHHVLRYAAAGDGQLDRLLSGGHHFW